jgi:hypothetical protein
LAGILDQLRAEGLPVGEAYELAQPDRTDVTISDHDGHRVSFDTSARSRERAWIWAMVSGSLFAGINTFCVVHSGALRFVGGYL